MHVKSLENEYSFRNRNIRAMTETGRRQILKNVKMYPAGSSLYMHFLYYNIQIKVDLKCERHLAWNLSQYCKAMVTKFHNDNLDREPHLEKYFHGKR